MTKAKAEYERVAVRAERGEYELVDPLDYIILEMMPEEGQMFAGLYPIGETTLNLAKKIVEKIPAAKGNIDSKIVSSRVRIMHNQHLTTLVRTTANSGGKSAWQRTKAGSEVLRKRQKEQGANGDHS